MADIRNLQSLQLTKDSTSVFYGGKSTTIPLIAGQYVTVLSFKIPRKEGYLLKRNPKVFLKLYNTSNEQISDNCKLMISIKKSVQELAQEIGTYKEYFGYSDLTLADQNNSKFDSAVRFEMKKEGLFPAESELLVLVHSPISDNIDWTKSKLSIGEIGSTDLQRGDM
ncbi:MAG: hypothetical protein IE890_00885 [Arcobacter sp.]|nr:hypothetical protein [Arcobacter sp.]